MRLSFSCQQVLGDLAISNSAKKLELVQFHTEVPVNNSIVLTEVRKTDALAFASLLNDKDVQRQTLNIPSPCTPEDTMEWIERWEQKTQQQGRVLSFVIRDMDGNVLGGAGFNHLRLGEHRGELSYWLGKPHWDQGIMTEVVHRLLELGFHAFHLQKVYAITFANNPASQRVLLKNNFRLEGEMRRHFEKNGKFYDAKFYGICLDEFRFKKS